MAFPASAGFASTDSRGRRGADPVTPAASRLALGLPCGRSGGGVESVTGPRPQSSPASIQRAVTVSVCPPRRDPGIAVRPSPFCFPPPREPRPGDRVSIGHGRQKSIEIVMTGNNNS